MDISEDMDQYKTGHFGFSAVSMDNLGATEYTEVVIVCDRSGSTGGFQQDMEDVLKEIVKSCAHSPRADNLLVRVLSFDNTHQEVHGFKLLESINPDDYNDVLRPGGATALYDATLDGIESVKNHAVSLNDQDFDCNAILFVMTDGDDNRSTYGLNQIKDALKDCIQSEVLESLVSILVGVNVTSPHMGNRLKEFQADSGFTDYVELGDASKKTLAKLAQFVSESISSQSQSLGSGGPSASIKF